jgi:uncharacterized protein
MTDRRGSVAAFFLLTFAMSWASWAAWAMLRDDRAVLAEVAYYVGVFAPAIVGVAMTAWQDGRAGVDAVLRRLIKAQVPARFYLFALLYFVAVKAVVALAYRAITGNWPTLTSEPWILLVLGTLVSIPAQAGEEIGWRGFALPRLGRRIGLGWASIIIGVLWGAWHLPFFFVAGVDKSGQSFPLYVLGVTALSVAFTWLYVRTGGSLLLTMILHSAVNNTNFLHSIDPAATNPFAFGRSLVAWLTVGVLWIGAGYFLVRIRGERATVRATRS